MPPAQWRTREESPTADGGGDAGRSPPAWPFLDRRRLRCKALGASNADVAGQFAGEALALALLGGAAGLALAAGGGSVLGDALVGTTQAGTQAAPDVGTLALGLALAVGFGLLGALYTVLGAVRLRPVEAIRRS